MKGRIQHSENAAWLSPRGRQIMEIVYRLGSATAAEIRAEMADPPTYTSVRGLLRVLEQKGMLTHREDGPRYVYEPIRSRQSTGASCLRQVIATFFGGSPSDAVAALVGDARKPLNERELKRLEAIVERARKRML